MEYRKSGNGVAVRLEKGDEIMESLLRVAKAENIKTAAVTGIGATDDLTVGVLDLSTRVYKEYKFTGNHEINALCGNITVKDGAPYAHVHVTCTGDGNKVVGGHLIKAVVSVTGEVFLTVFDGEIGRKFDENVGINVWKL